MSLIKSVSTKSLIIGEVSQFLENEAMECTETLKGLAELIHKLQIYREEGNDLFPDIYIVDDFDLIMKSIPFLQSCYIGEGEKNSNTMLKALKKCAPLAINNWAIYIHRQDDKFKFGLIRPTSQLFAVPIENIILEDNDFYKAILVHKISINSVELLGIKSKPLHVCFGTNSNEDFSPMSSQLKFIKEIVAKVPTKLREPTRNFFQRLFKETSIESHGTLACVIKDSKYPKRLIDGIILNPKLNIPLLIENSINKGGMNVELSNSKIQGAFHLIKGMLKSDGITVFTNTGSVASYNIFIKHHSEIANSKIHGGARSRTYYTLEKFLNKGIEAAYMQSQDGEILTKSKNEQ